MILDVSCNDLGFILRIIGYLFKICQWIIPLLLIALIVFDLFKTMTGSLDDKAKSEAISRIGKRFVYAIIVFLIPVLVKMIFSTIGRANVSNTTSWVSCFNTYFK